MKEIIKKRYEKPEIVDFIWENGVGDCRVGSAPESGDCTAGTNAPTYCTSTGDDAGTGLYSREYCNDNSMYCAGNTAGTDCSAGSNTG